MIEPRDLQDAQRVALRLFDMSDTDAPKQRSFTWKFLQSICAIVTRVMFDLKVRGREHLPRTGGVLIVSNHQSYIDPVVLAVTFQRPFAYLADAYLFKFKPFGRLIAALNSIPIRENESVVAACALLYPPKNLSVML